MSSDIQERRIRLMQAREAEALKARFTAFEVFGTAQWSDLPDWVDPELALTRRTDSVPDAVLSESADDETVRRWMGSFLSAAGIGDRFYLLTGIEHFPWLDLAVADDRWLDNLVDVKGFGPTIVSHDRDVLVVFYEEEYEYQVFRRTSRE
jgi:hypothetical protein